MANTNEPNTLNCYARLTDLLAYTTLTMKKLFLVYFAILATICASFVLLKKTYDEWTTYSELTHRANNILLAYQDLNTQISNAAVLNPKLVDVQNKSQTFTIFSADKKSILKNLVTLNYLVKDSINIKITKQLTSEIPRELNWIFNSDVPDSILHQQAKRRLAALESVIRHMNQGINRTRFLIDYRSRNMNRSFNQLILLVFIFLSLTLSLLTYTILSLFNQRVKGKKKDSKLKEKDLQYLHVLDNMLEGVQIHDFNWRYTYVNDALAKHSRCKKEELIGISLLEKYPGIENTDLFKELEICMTQRLSKQMETEFTFPDGNVSIFEISIQPIPEGLFILSIDKSEQHKAKEKITASELKYRNIVETIHESLIIEDLEGKLVYANKEFSNIFGFEGDDLKTISLKDYTSEDSYDEIVMRHNKRIQGISVENEFVYKGKRKDGKEIWIEARVSPLIENGQITGTQTLERDITARVIAEEKGKKLSRMFAFLSAINQSIVHSANQDELMDTLSAIAIEIGQFKLAYMGLLDENNKLQIVSLSGDKHGAERILKMSGLDVNDPMYQDAPTVKAIKSGQIMVNNDMPNDPSLTLWKDEFTKQGIHASISLPLYKSGNTIGILGFHAANKGFFDTQEIELLREAAGDISFALENFERNKKHKETEEQLFRNEKRFRGIIEKSADFKTLTDKNGRLTYCSPSVVKAFGYTMEEFLNRDAMSFFHPDDTGELIKKRNSILEKPGDSYYFQYRILHKNGTWIWCEGTVTNFLNEPGIEAMVSNFRDISENKKNALEKETLIKQLTQNNHDLRQFAYITSHNLRGPIANLLGLTNLLDSLKIKDPTLLTILGGIKTATLMFDETLKDLAMVLTVREDPAIQLETIRFTETFEKIKGFCEKSIIDSRAQIQSNFNDANRISFNKAYLESILINLLTNAIKYKDDSRPLKIHVKTFVVDGHIHLQFSDNGIGFDYEMQKEKVFKLYQRFHLHKEGKGLGLFLIKSQLDALGGDIEVESKINIGSTFTIKFDKSHNPDAW